MRHYEVGQILPFDLGGRIFRPKEELFVEYERFRSGCLLELGGQNLVLLALHFFEVLHEIRLCDQPPKLRVLGHDVTSNLRKLIGL